MIVPIGCMYTPLHASENLRKIEYDPILCKGKSCSAVLNPYCQVDYMNKIWVCPFCLTRNHFPIHYNDISSDNLPAELIHDFTTVEYQLSEAHLIPPVFVFVIDICMLQDELQQVKDSILQSLWLLPENSFVGLITYGKNVNVHELGFQECPKSYVFRGDPKKALTVERISDLLGFGVQQKQNISTGSRFLVPVSDCEFVLTTILDELSQDP